MKVIVGLGNPGIKYRNNRHNVGYMFVDAVHHTSEVMGFQNTSEVKLVKTDCFMNLSGNFVKKLIENWKLKIENLIIVHDDLDIPLGKFKIQKGQGPKLHNGISSIERALKTKDFWRVRIGVDNRQINPPAGGWIDGETYVLSDFKADEEKKILKLFPTIYQQLLNIIRQ